jgi:sugar lactone lactonase YvrE
MRPSAAGAVLGLVVALSGRATGTVAEGDVARAVGPCTAQQVCTFADPEDLADLVGTPWLMVSEGPVGGSSGLSAFNTKTGTIIRFSANDIGPSCLAEARGGGIGVRREAGGYRLVRILHAPRTGAGLNADAVETFRITLDGHAPRLERTACVAAPSPYFLNDIAAMSDGGFAATHMFDPAIPRDQREAAFLAGIPTGYLVRWTPVTGWTRIPHSEGSFLNGLDVSRDGRWLAFAETYGRQINRIRPDGSGRTTVRLAMQPDNVTALGDGRFIVVGGTGKPLISTRRCPELRRPGCGFPAMAARVDFDRSRVQPMVTGGGVSTPGFSVGLVKRGRLYLGTAFGDRITIVSLGRLPVDLP